MPNLFCFICKYHIFFRRSSVCVGTSSRFSSHTRSHRYKLQLQRLFCVAPTYYKLQLQRLSCVAPTYYSSMTEMQCRFVDWTCHMFATPQCVFRMLRSLPFLPLEFHLKSFLNWQRQMPMLLSDKGICQLGHNQIMSCVCFTRSLIFNVICILVLPPELVICLTQFTSIHRYKLQLQTLSCVAPTLSYV
jgi:hypothetical protein